MPPFKYALVVNDDYMTIPQLSAHFGVHKSVLAKAAKRGELSVAWIEAWKRQRWLFAEARRIGVSSDLIWHRRRAWGECDRVYLEPPQERFRKLSACRKERAARRELCLPAYFVRGHVADALRYDGGNSHEFMAWLGHGVMVSESDNGMMMLENAPQKAFMVRVGEIVLRESDGSLVTITSIPR